MVNSSSFDAANNNTGGDRSGAKQARSTQGHETQASPQSASPVTAATAISCETGSSHAASDTSLPCVVSAAIETQAKKTNFDDGTMAVVDTSNQNDSESDDKHVLCSITRDKFQSVLPTYSRHDNGTTLEKGKSKPKLLCLFCDRSFGSANLRQKHVERIHSVKQNRRVSGRRQNVSSLACIYCDKMSNVEHTLNDLFKHMVAEHPNKYFGCLPCSDRFISQIHLSDHNDLNHSSSDTSEVKPELLSPSIELVIALPEPEDHFPQKKTRSRLKPKVEDPLSLPEEEEFKKPADVKKKRSSSLKDLKNKVLCKSSKMVLKRSKRLQAQVKEADSEKRRTSKRVQKNTEPDLNNSTKLPDKSKSESNNPYPEFDHFYRIKKITDHSIDNLKITSLTFDDVFDKAFFNRIKCNIEDNLLHHIDGKLFKNEESETRISNFEKLGSQTVQSSTSENYGCELTLNAITPVAALCLNSQYGEDFESQIEYGSKPSKKKTTPVKKDEIHYKYFTRRKYQASILEQKENRDLSRLDMWTQLVIKERQQKIINDKKSAKEVLEYTSGEEYKTKIKREELDRILDRRGPFEDLKEEISKKAAFDKLNSTSENAVSAEVFTVVREVVNEILTRVLEQFEEEPVAVTTDKSLDHRLIPAFLNLRRTSTLPEEEIDKSDRIALICSSQETENFELPTNKIRKKDEAIELTGEWARSRIYICAACGDKFPNLKFLLEHKSAYHANVWAQHYEFVGNQSELYRHLSIPGLGKMGVLEENTQCKQWRRSNARKCAKCKKQCNSLGELHRHVLECGGDWNWILARKKCKYRPFGTKSRKKRRGFIARIRRKEKTDSSDAEKKIYKKTYYGPRSKPSDAETIQRMLANLPAKRSRRSFVSLRDVIFKSRKGKHSTNSTLQSRDKSGDKPSSNQSKAQQNSRSINLPSARKTLRNINKVLSSTILDSSLLRVKRKIKLANEQRITRQSRKISDNSEQAIISTENDNGSFKEIIKNKKPVKESEPLILSNTDIQNKIVRKRILNSRLNIKNYFPVKKHNSRLNAIYKNSELETEIIVNPVNIRPPKNIPLMEKPKRSRQGGGLKGLVRNLRKKSNSPSEDKVTNSDFKRTKLTRTQSKESVSSDKSTGKTTAATITPEKDYKRKSLKEKSLTKLEGKHQEKQMNLVKEKIVNKIKEKKCLKKIKPLEENLSDVKPKNKTLKKKFQTIIKDVKNLKLDSSVQTIGKIDKTNSTTSGVELAVNPHSIFLERSISEKVENSIRMMGKPTSLEAKEEGVMKESYVPVATSLMDFKENPPIPEKMFNLEPSNEEQLQAKGELNFDKKLNVSTIDESNDSLVTPSTSLSTMLSINIDTLDKPKHLISPTLSSPNIKGKIRKPAKGLNDCIAMLTSKLQQKEIAKPLPVLTVEKTENKITQIQPPKLDIQKPECILRIPTFKVTATSEFSPTETALDLSKKSVKRANLTNKLESTSVCFKPPTELQLSEFGSTLNKVIGDVIEHKCKEVLSEKLTSHGWTSVNEIIQKVINSESKNLSRKLTDLSFPKNNVDDSIEAVIKRFSLECDTPNGKSTKISERSSCRKKISFIKDSTVKSTEITLTSLLQGGKGPETIQHDTPEFTRPAVFSNSETQKKVLEISTLPSASEDSDELDIERLIPETKLQRIVTKEVDFLDKTEDIFLKPIQNLAIPNSTNMPVFGTSRNTRSEERAVKNLCLESRILNSERDFIENQIVKPPGQDMALDTCEDFEKKNNPALSCPKKRFGKKEKTTGLEVTTENASNSTHSLIDHLSKQNNVLDNPKLFKMSGNKNQLPVLKDLSDFEPVSKTANHCPKRKNKSVRIKERDKHTSIESKLSTQNIETKLLETSDIIAHLPSTEPVPVLGQTQSKTTGKKKKLANKITANQHLVEPTVLKTLASSDLTSNMANCTLKNVEGEVLLKNLSKKKNKKAKLLKQAGSIGKSRGNTFIKFSGRKKINGKAKQKQKSLAHPKDKKGEFSESLNDGVLEDDIPLFNLTKQNNGNSETITSTRPRRKKSNNLAKGDLSPVFAKNKKVVSNFINLPAKTQVLNQTSHNYTEAPRLEHEPVTNFDKNEENKSKEKTRSIKTIDTSKDLLEDANKSKLFTFNLSSLPVENVGTCGLDEDKSNQKNSFKNLSPETQISNQASDNLTEPPKIEDVLVTHLDWKEGNAKSRGKNKSNKILNTNKDLLEAAPKNKNSTLNLLNFSVENVKASGLHELTSNPRNNLKNLSAEPQILNQTSEDHFTETPRIEDVLVINSDRKEDKAKSKEKNKSIKIMDTSKDSLVTITKSKNYTPNLLNWSDENDKASGLDEVAFNQRNNLKHLSAETQISNQATDNFTAPPRIEDVLVTNLDRKQGKAKGKNKFKKIMDTDKDLSEATTKNKNSPSSLLNLSVENASVLDIVTLNQKNNFINRYAENQISNQTSDNFIEPPIIEDVLVTNVNRKKRKAKLKGKNKSNKIKDTSKDLLKATTESKHVTSKLLNLPIENTEVSGLDDITSNQRDISVETHIPNQTSDNFTEPPRIEEVLLKNLDRTEGKAKTKGKNKSSKIIDTSKDLLEATTKSKNFKTNLLNLYMENIEASWLDEVSSNQRSNECKTLMAGNKNITGKIFDQVKTKTVRPQRKTKCIKNKDLLNKNLMTSHLSVGTKILQEDVLHLKFPTPSDDNPLISPKRLDSISEPASEENKPINILSQEQPRQKRNKSGSKNVTSLVNLATEKSCILKDDIPVLSLSNQNIGIELKDLTCNIKELSSPEHKTTQNKKLIKEISESKNVLSTFGTDIKSLSVEPQIKNESIKNSPSHKDPKVITKITNIIHDSESMSAEHLEASGLNNKIPFPSLSKQKEDPYFKPFDKVARISIAKVSKFKHKRKKVVTKTLKKKAKRKRSTLKNHKINKPAVDKLNKTPSNPDLQFSKPYFSNQCDLISSSNNPTATEPLDSSTPIMSNKSHTRRKSKTMKKNDKVDNELFKDFALVINKKTKRIPPTSIVDDSVCDDSLESLSRSTELIKIKINGPDDSFQEMDMELEESPIDSEIIVRDSKVELVSDFEASILNEPKNVDFVKNKLSCTLNDPESHDLDNNAAIFSNIKDVTVIGKKRKGRPGRKPKNKHVSDNLMGQIQDKIKPEENVVQKSCLSNNVINQDLPSSCKAKDELAITFKGIEKEPAINFKTSQQSTVGAENLDDFTLLKLGNTTDIIKQNISQLTLESKIPCNNRQLDKDTISDTGLLHENTCKDPLQNKHFPVADHIIEGPTLKRRSTRTKNCEEKQNPDLPSTEFLPSMQTTLVSASDIQENVTIGTNLTSVKHKKQLDLQISKNNNKTVVCKRKKNRRGRKCKATEKNLMEKIEKNEGLSEYNQQQSDMSSGVEVHISKENLSSQIEPKENKPIDELKVASGNLLFQNTIKLKISSCKSKGKNIKINKTGKPSDQLKELPLDTDTSLSSIFNSVPYVELSKDLSLSFSNNVLSTMTHIIHHTDGLHKNKIEPNPGKDKIHDNVQKDENSSLVSTIVEDQNINLTRKKRQCQKVNKISYIENSDIIINGDLQSDYSDLPIPSSHSNIDINADKASDKISDNGIVADINNLIRSKHLKYNLKHQEPELQNENSIDSGLNSSDLTPQTDFKSVTEDKLFENEMLDLKEKAENKRKCKTSKQNLLSFSQLNKSNRNSTAFHESGLGEETYETKEATFNFGDNSDDLTILKSKRRGRRQKPNRETNDFDQTCSSVLLTNQSDNSVGIIDIESTSSKNKFHSDREMEKNREKNITDEVFKKKSKSPGKGNKKSEKLNSEYEPIIYKNIFEEIEEKPFRTRSKSKAIAEQSTSVNSFEATGHNICVNACKDEKLKVLENIIAEETVTKLLTEIIIDKNVSEFKERNFKTSRKSKIVTERKFDEAIALNTTQSTGENKELFKNHEKCKGLDCDTEYKAILSEEITSVKMLNTTESTEENAHCKGLITNGEGCKIVVDGNNKSRSDDLNECNSELCPIALKIVSSIVADNVTCNTKKKNHKKRKNAKQIIQTLTLSDNISQINTKKSSSKEILPTASAETSSTVKQKSFLNSMDQPTMPIKEIIVERIDKKTTLEKRKNSLERKPYKDKDSEDLSEKEPVLADYQKTNINASNSSFVTRSHTSESDLDKQADEEVASLTCGNWSSLPQTDLDESMQSSISEKESSPVGARSPSLSPQPKHQEDAKIIDIVPVLNKSSDIFDLIKKRNVTVDKPLTKDPEEPEHFEPKVPKLSMRELKKSKGLLVIDEKDAPKIIAPENLVSDIPIAESQTDSTQLLTTCNEVNYDNKLLKSRNKQNNKKHKKNKMTRVQEDVFKLFNGNSSLDFDQLKSTIEKMAKPVIKNKDRSKDFVSEIEPLTEILTSSDMDIAPVIDEIDKSLEMDDIYDFEDEPEPQEQNRRTSNRTAKTKALEHIQDEALVALLDEDITVAEPDNIKAFKKTEKNSKIQADILEDSDQQKGEKIYEKKSIHKKSRNLDIEIQSLSLEKGKNDFECKESFKQVKKAFLKKSNQLKKKTKIKKVKVESTDLVKKCEHVVEPQKVLDKTITLDIQLNSSVLNSSLEVIDDSIADNSEVMTGQTNILPAEKDPINPHMYQESNSEESLWNKMFEAAQTQNEILKSPEKKIDELEIFCENITENRNKLQESINFENADAEKIDTVINKDIYNKDLDSSLKEHPVKKKPGRKNKKELLDQSFTKKLDLIESNPEHVESLKENQVIDIVDPENQHILTNECNKDNHELRRSRRGFQKIISYNENDLIDPVVEAYEKKRQSLHLKKDKPIDKITSDANDSAKEHCTVERPETECAKTDLVDKIYEFTDSPESEEKISESISVLRKNKSKQNDVTLESSLDLSMSDIKAEKIDRFKTPASSVYCEICKKTFQRIENLVKHKTTLTHISKLSELEAKEVELRNKQKQTKEIGYCSQITKKRDGIGMLEISDAEKSVSNQERPQITNNETLQLQDIINEVLDKPEINSKEPENFSSYNIESDSVLETLKLKSKEKYSPTLTKTIVEKQISLLENIIEKTGGNLLGNIFKTSTQIESDDEMREENIADVPPSYKQHTTPLHMNEDFKSMSNRFAKPDQYEEISEDSTSLSTYDEQKSRKILNRDEELFLECCSLLKSGSEVSNFSKQSKPQSSVVQKRSNIFGSRPLILPEEDAHEFSDNSRTPTPLGDTFDDNASGSNSIASEWNPQPVDKIGKNFTFKEALSEEPLMPVAPRDSSSVDGNTDKLNADRARNDSGRSTPTEYIEPHVNDKDIEKMLPMESKKIITKGARKIFEGLKISIPTEDLNLDIISYHKKDPVENLIESPGRSKGRKSKPTKKTQIGSDVLFKVKKKKSPRLPTEKIDVYSFEDTQEQSELFTKPDFSVLQNQKNEKDIEFESTVFDDSNGAEADLGSNASTYSLLSAKKSEPIVENITKKKSKVMSKIFRNAAKSRMGEIEAEMRDMPEIPEIDNLDLVENYVLSCSQINDRETIPSSDKEDKSFNSPLENDPKKSKMTEQEMDKLFDQLIGKKPEEKPRETKSRIKSLTKVKADFNNKILEPKKLEKLIEVKKKQSKQKGRKRARSHSETDDEFNLNKTKKASRKKKENNVINLEQELRECIGVASRKSQRSCTSGKQNILVEYWSSDDEAFERMLQAQNNKKPTKPKSKKSLTKEELLSKEIEKSLDIALENSLKDDKENSLNKIADEEKTTTTEKKKPGRKKKLATDNQDKTDEMQGDPELNETATSLSRRKRVASNPLYHWSSSSEDDEPQSMVEITSIREDEDDDRPIQHGWIVGDSPKKLVTMLALTKGKKTDVDCVKEQNKKKSNAVS